METCVLITTTPNELMEPIHNRMPVILARDHWEEWLDCSRYDEASLLSALKPYPADKMEAYAVSKFVNAVKNDSTKCIEPIVEGKGLFG